MKIKILIITIASVFVAITCCSCTHKESREKEQATTECRGSSHETSGCDASIIRNGYWYRDDVYQVRDDVLQLFDALNSYDWYCMSLDSNICETRGYIERLCQFYDKHIHEVNNISDHEKADAVINRIVQYYMESQKEDNNNMGEIVSAALYSQLSTNGGDGGMEGVSE